MKITDEQGCENILNGYSTLFIDRINFLYNYYSRNSIYKNSLLIKRLNEGTSSLQSKKGYINRNYTSVMEFIEHNSEFYIRNLDEYKSIYKTYYPLIKAYFTEIKTDTSSRDEYNSYLEDCKKKIYRRYKLEKIMNRM
jgi:hypothetical protein